MSGFEQGARKREKPWPSSLGFVCGAVIFTLLELGCLETLAVGRPRPKNGLKHLKSYLNRLPSDMYNYFLV